NSRIEFRGGLIRSTKAAKVLPTIAFRVSQAVVHPSVKLSIIPFHQLRKLPQRVTALDFRSSQNSLHSMPNRDKMPVTRFKKLFQMPCKIPQMIDQMPERILFNPSQNL